MSFIFPELSCPNRGWQERFAAFFSTCRCEPGNAACFENEYAAIDLHLEVSPEGSSKHDRIPSFSMQPNILSRQHGANASTEMDPVLRVLPVDKTRIKGPSRKPCSPSIASVSRARSLCADDGLVEIDACQEEHTARCDAPVQAACPMHADGASKGEDIACPETVTHILPLDPAEALKCSVECCPGAGDAGFARDKVHIPFETQDVSFSPVDHAEPISADRVVPKTLGYLADLDLDAVHVRLPAHPIACSESYLAHCGSSVGEPAQSGLAVPVDDKASSHASIAITATEHKLAAVPASEYRQSLDSEGMSLLHNDLTKLHADLGDASGRVREGYQDSGSAVADEAHAPAPATIPTNEGAQSKQASSQFIGESCGAHVATSGSEEHAQELAGHAMAIQEQDPVVDVNQSRCAHDDTLVHVGDIVVLGDRTPPEYRHSSAIVTHVAEAHSTVVVLDSSRRFGCGECWPGFSDIFPETQLLRLGTRVVIGEMQGNQTKHLNGLTGVISKHPRQGHPVFIKKTAANAPPQLAVCVVFDDSTAAKQRSALLEPRFLKAFDEVTLQKVQALGEAAAMLSDCKSELIEQGSRSIVATPIVGFMGA